MALPFNNNEDFLQGSFNNNTESVEAEKLRDKLQNGTLTKDVITKGCCNSDCIGTFCFVVCVSSFIGGLCSTAVSVVMVVRGQNLDAHVVGIFYVILGSGALILAISIPGCIGAAYRRVGAYLGFGIITLSLFAIQGAVALTLVVGNKSVNDNVVEILAYVVIALAFSNVLLVLTSMIVGYWAYRSALQTQLQSKQWCQGIAVHYVTAAHFLCIAMSGAVIALSANMYVKEVDEMNQYNGTEPVPSTNLTNADTLFIAMVGGACGAFFSIFGLIFTRARSKSGMLWSFIFQILSFATVIVGSTILAININNDVTNEDVELFWVAYFMILLTAMEWILIVFAGIVFVTDSEELYAADYL